jgi:alkaline phosphatase D
MTACFIRMGGTVVLLLVVVQAAASPPVQPPVMGSALLDRSVVISRVAFGSCYVPQFERSEIWHTILASNPDIFLFLGDNVYQSEEHGESGLKELREAYTALAGDQPFAALRERVHVATIWDDHDYGLNDAGAEFAPKYESEALFEHVWAVPDDDLRRSRDGVYHRIEVGQRDRTVQFLLLDTRFFRTTAAGDTGGQQATVLGEDQWRWLRQALSVPAAVRIVASSIPVLSSVIDGEAWHRWPGERAQLLSLLSEASGRVILLSGDSHFGSLYRWESTGRQPLWEVTSSSLNFPLPDEKQATFVNEDSLRIGAPHFRENFGLLRIDWEDGSILLELRDRAGDVLAEQRVGPQTQ